MLRWYGWNLIEFVCVHANQMWECQVIKFPILYAQLIDLPSFAQTWSLYIMKTKDYCKLFVHIHNPWLCVWNVFMTKKIYNIQMSTILRMHSKFFKNDAHFFIIYLILPSCRIKHSIKIFVHIWYELLILSMVSPWDWHLMWFMETTCGNVIIG